MVEYCINCTFPLLHSHCSQSNIRSTPVKKTSTIESSVQHQFGAHRMVLYTLLLFMEYTPRDLAHLMQAFIKNTQSHYFFIFQVQQSYETHDFFDLSPGKCLQRVLDLVFLHYSRLQHIELRNDLTTSVSKLRIHFKKTKCLMQYLIPVLASIIPTMRWSSICFR